MSQFESVNDYISFMKTHPNMTCPIKHTLDIIGGKWKLFIVLQLFGSEQLRFSQLSKNIPGITNTVLSGCLRDMEKDGIILRHQFNEIPPMWSILSPRRAEHFQMCCWPLPTGEWRIKG